MQLAYSTALAHGAVEFIYLLLIYILICLTYLFMDNDQLHKKSSYLYAKKQRILLLCTIQMPLNNTQKVENSHNNLNAVQIS